MPAETSYQGTPSLPPEVKTRVLSIFRHALDAYKEGRTDEAASGCDLLLAIDSAFAPARELQQLLTNPSPEALKRLETAAAGPEDPLSAARAAMEARDFERVVEICSAVLRSDVMNEDAQTLASTAQERLEAAPFIEQFIRTAQSQADAGNLAGARATLDKARSLDPTHPLIDEVQQATERQAGIEPQTSMDDETPLFVDPAASFIVEEAPAPASPPPADGRSASGDFGFTFEEDQKSDFSFGTAATADFALDREPPAPPAPSATAPPPVIAGEAHTFDFTTAAIDISDDEQEKISHYLAEGDAAFDERRYQTAIDLWSRIFLIDVTNDEASERIERARKLRLDLDRRIEDLVVAGTVAFEKKDYATARDKFAQVAQLDPDHAAAADYLSRLEGVGTAGDDEILPPSSWSGPSTLDVLDEIAPPSTDRGDIYVAEEPRAEPVQSERKARTAAVTAPPAPATSRKSMMSLLVIPLLLIVAAGGAWFGYQKYSRSQSPAGDSANAQTVFRKAEALVKRGQLDQAIRLLSTISPDDPQHDRALGMIADLKAQKAQSAGLIDGRPAAQVFQELLQQAAAAYAAHDYLAAKQALEKAAGIRTLPPEDQQRYASASEQVAKLDQTLLLFKEGNYDQAVTNLEALLAQNPENRNIRQLLANAHFNLGVEALRDERTAEAMAAFDRSLAAVPGDEMATRSRELAARYDKQDKDLLYRIFVKYLPLR